MTLMHSTTNFAAPLVERIFSAFLLVLGAVVLQKEDWVFLF